MITVSLESEYIFNLCTQTEILDCGIFFKFPSPTL